MRAALLLVLLVLASCRRETNHAPAPPAPPTPPAPTTPPASAPIADAAPPRALPAEKTLRGIFKGASAKGFVAITGDGQRASFGLPGGAADVDRPVLVASFTKLWVAVATLRLVARNELALDDTIRSLVPELASKPWADSTVRELLGHTSRVPEFGNGFFSRTDVDFSRPAATLAKEVSSATEKRSVWKYRNSEYAMLGAILEAKSGTNMAGVLEKEVFTPAAMKHAGIVVRGRPAEVDFVPMGRVRPENFFTAGNGYASAGDLLSFFEALDGDALLDADGKKTLFAGAPNHDQAALGCWAYPYAGTTLVERPGSFGNVKLVTMFYPEHHRALVFWSSDVVEVGRPRTKDSIASKLAHALLD